MKKCMKNELKKKKRKGKIVLSAQEDKNLEENLRENDNHLSWIGRRYRAKKLFEKF